ncbi:hypothetical protein ANN_22578 [Periplaneta americana]|uniref:Uncharacterized protein n=1 Tax=Periplaneta americana TaxID=6978 RepID=A0ABQ8S8I3_PERAM|nr:hypothetical protein ANN_22578 [Periplaneta americana]
MDEGLMRNLVLCKSGFQVEAPCEVGLNNFKGKIVLAPDIDPGTLRVWPVYRDVFHDCHFVAAMPFETDDVPVMHASTIEPVNEEIPEPNRPNTMIPEKGAIASGRQDSSKSLPADAVTLAPKLQVSLGEISPIPNNIYLGRSTNKAQKMVVMTSSPYKQRQEEVKSKQLKGDILKILYRRSSSNQTLIFFK